MRLVVVSHKPCWTCSTASSGFASNGGFPFQMRALSELFDSTVLAVPVSPHALHGEIPLNGQGLSVLPLSQPAGTEVGRKLRFPLWFLRNAPRLVRAIWHADAVHAPIPGDVGTIGMVIAVMLGKPLFVRYCGNWFVQTTAAERFWKWFMERTAGGRNVMIATGGAVEPPSLRNRAVRWIFSTTLMREELESAARLKRGAPVGRLIIVCRQEGGKGTDVLIDSLPLVARRFPAATLEIVGDGADMPHLKDRVLSTGTADRVTFHGAVDHGSVMRLLQSADVFCYPTTTEGFPKVVLEALACGLPVITTRVSVLPQLVDGCGVLLDSTTPEAVAAAICATLGDADAYRSMSDRAVARAQAFSLESWRDTIGEVLRAAWGPLQVHA